MPRSNLLQVDLSQLVTIAEASSQLGRGYSRRSIIRRIDSGEWKEGIHWVDDRRDGALKRIIKINLVEVNKLRQVPAGRR
ncbi:hypothetical protein Ava_D0045 [Trichormus variabilis ATCC 29413]|uniref:Uncharacterized protein n=2 Tax=Anabaena variabilis TaxID=264691 RepID=Q3M2S6_TRIV2|nr:hypothetical protein [Trichormus variabilis]ABA24710.1 hypothetical protein Ava_D0045 [Trichormus variabilis ATCC 29413]MBC1217699.1 hypothetical protein [Trichormus variabilis ARAD]MBC1259029.1 hypothetical protein [Trichormus variabilis V5]MBC1301285.1 hypothetical protein [Trichormus variabilis N2B]MBC1324522.1 hypothetical protein [Trichormus variabilis 9RC]